MFLFTVFTLKNFTSSVDHRTTRKEIMNANEGKEEASKVDAINMRDVRKYSDLNMKDAAKRLQVGTTTLKLRLRKQTPIYFWPQRQINTINNILEESPVELSDEDKKKLLRLKMNFRRKGRQPAMVRKLLDLTKIYSKYRRRQYKNLCGNKSSVSDATIQPAQSFTSQSIQIPASFSVHHDNTPQGSIQEHESQGSIHMSELNHDFDCSTFCFGEQQLTGIQYDEDLMMIGQQMHQEELNILNSLLI